MIDNLQNINDIPVYIFGGESSVNSFSEPIAALVEPASVGSWFVVVASAVLLFYLTWINHWSVRNQSHLTLFSLFFYFRGDYPTKFNELAPSFKTYSGVGSCMGYLVVWLAIVTSLALQPQIAMAAIMGVVVVNIYQELLIYLIGVVVNSREFSKLLSHLKAVWYTIVGIIAIPTVLCFSLTDGTVQEVFMYITVIQIVAIALMYFIKTFLLFLTKKVSLLHTILYLCAVEIFPITLVWGFFCR